ncbi:MAG: monovalent cation/H(+) antiporter subunit G [Clostridiales bacterium]|nr:monovalent cation/H(+) antiporter subunit G [Clostridiales bacterium]
MLDWIRFILTTIFLLAALTIFVSQFVGVHRFRYVLNRMHAAAMGDTLGLFFGITGVCISATSVDTLIKFILVVLFMWFASPVSSHLIAKLEWITNPDISKEAEVKEL